MKDYLSDPTVTNQFLNPFNRYLYRAWQAGPSEKYQYANQVLALAETECDTPLQRAAFLQSFLHGHLPTRYKRLDLPPQKFDFAELAQVLLPKPLPHYPSAELGLPADRKLRLADARLMVRPPRKAKEAAGFTDLKNAFYAWDSDTCPCCPNCGHRTHWTQLIGDRHHRHALLHKCPNPACNMAFLSCD